MLRGQGWRALYAGYSGTLLRDLPYTALELGTYQSLRAWFRHGQGEGTGSAAGRDGLAAAGAGALAAVLTTPLDLLRTRQVATTAAAAAAGGTAPPILSLAVR